jgi:hypothetical protein
VYRVLIRQTWDGEETLINTDVGNVPRLLTCQVTKAVGSYDTLSMTMAPTNPGYNQLRPHMTFIRVVRVQPARVIFEGRITTIKPSLANDGVIQVQAGSEGLAAMMHDSVQPWAEFHNTTPKAFLQALIDQHNAQVEPYKQIKLGNVTVTNSTDNVYRYTDDTKDTFDTITDKLVSRLGGETRIRHESDGLYLDYMPQIGVQANQVVRLKSNLLSLSSQVDPSDVITVLKPLGATQERTTAEGEADTSQTSNPRLTIETVNNGSPFLVDKTLVAEFGIHVGAVTWDDVKNPTNLMKKGADWFGTQHAALETVQLSAVDLSLVGYDVDDFVCGNYYRVVCDILRFDKNLRYVGMLIDAVAPLNSTITAGDLALSAEDYAMTLYKAAQKVDGIESGIVLLTGKTNAASLTASEASKNAEAANELVGQLQTQFTQANVSEIPATLEALREQISGFDTSVKEFDQQVADVKDGQTTSTGATLTTIEGRVKALEDAGGQPVEGDGK